MRKNIFKNLGIALAICSLGYARNVNAQTWSTLGSGTDGVLYALTIYNGNLYAGGNFTMAGGNSASNIAEWNGTNWSALGAGVNSYVQALAVYNGNLVAGGNFTTAGRDSAYYIAMWDGTNWSTLGGGMNGT